MPQIEKKPLSLSTKKTRRCRGYNKELYKNSVVALAALRYSNPICINIRGVITNINLFLLKCQDTHKIIALIV
jgi:hypothetical protein